jgi:hypothetical protein
VSFGRDDNDRFSGSDRGHHHGRALRYDHQRRAPARLIFVPVMPCAVIARSVSDEAIQLFAC